MAGKTPCTEPKKKNTPWSTELESAPVVQGIVALRATASVVKDFWNMLVSSTLAHFKIGKLKSVPQTSPKAQPKRLPPAGGLSQEAKQKDPMRARLPKRSQAMASEKPWDGSFTYRCCSKNLKKKEKYEENMEQDVVQIWSSLQLV